MIPPRLLLSKKMPHAPSWWATFSMMRENGQPLCRLVVGPPVWREPLALGLEDLHLPAEQVHFCSFLIPLDQQPHDRRGGGGQACTGQLIGLAQQDGHGIDQTQHSRR